jgi:hypothetical protein
MANTKSNSWESQTIIRPGYIEYPLPEGVERIVTSGKWGTAIANDNVHSTIRKPASRKKK